MDRTAVVAVVPVMAVVAVVAVVAVLCDRHGQRLRSRHLLHRVDVRRRTRRCLTLSFYRISLVVQAIDFFLYDS